MPPTNTARPARAASGPLAPCGTTGSGTTGSGTTGSSTTGSGTTGSGTTGSGTTGSGTTGAHGCSASAIPHHGPDGSHRPGPALASRAQSHPCNVQRHGAPPDPAAGPTHAAAHAVDHFPGLAHFSQDFLAEVHKETLHDSPVPRLAGGNIRNLLPDLGVHCCGLIGVLDGLSGLALEVGSPATRNPVEQLLDESELHPLDTPVTSSLPPHSYKLRNGLPV